MAAFIAKDSRILSLQLQLKPSATLLLLWAFLSIGAALCIFYSNLPLLAQIPLSLVLLLYSGRILWQDILLKSQRAVVALRYCDDNSWQLQEGLGESLKAEIEGASVVRAYFCYLRFRLHDGQKKRSCLVIYDALDAESYRKLSIHLSTMKV